MRSLSGKIRISIILSIIPILSFFNACVTTTSQSSITEPKLIPIIAYDTEKLNLHFIKMETFGDAILIDLEETEILIDGGHPDSGVAAYLQKYVDGTLEAIVVTHPHPDHMGGLVEVLEKYEVNQIWLNGDIPLDNEPFFDLYKIFESRLNAEGAAIHEARRGQTIDVGILSFYILHPDKLVPSKRDASLGYRAYTMNKNSIVMRLRYGNISFLFTGDAPKEIEKDILKAGFEVQADILKVGHHASKGSSSANFLKSVKPKVAVYMSGVKQSSFGPKKPHPTTIAALKKSGAEVYGTKLGTIIIATDGTTFTIGTRK